MNRNFHNNTRGNGNGRGLGAGTQNKGGQPQTATLDTSRIKLANPIDAELFSSVAQNTAKELAKGGKEVNKSTQLRRFYDEVVMWETKVAQSDVKLAEYKPFILMLNAKAAYAEGRKHVDSNFTSLIRCCLSQISNWQSLRNFKLFFEAMLGFYKLEKN